MNQSNKKMLLLAVVGAPFLVLAVILLMISTGQDNKRMNEPPVGAGAGDTGGANAIGELIAHGSAKAPEVAAVNFEAAAKPETVEAQPKMVRPETLEQGFIVVVVDEPRLARPDSPIYIAGTYNGWDPKHPQYMLTAQSDMKWRIEIPHREGSPSLAFKFTRGGWDFEELDQAKMPVANRMLPEVDVSKLAPGEKPVLEFTVRNWKNPAEASGPKEGDPHRPLSVTGNVKRLQVQGGAGASAGMVRDLLVWLPPGYDLPQNANVTYPVLYMHDGQNLFEKHSKVPAEWGMDETAQKLISEGAMSPVIIVGIPHSGATRIAEYSPVAAMQGVEPQGERHIQWMMSEVMPRVERAFRVKTGRENTGIGGSSLGAVMSLYAAMKHPQTFGVVLAESTSTFVLGTPAWNEATKDVKAWPSRIYLGVGGVERGAEADKATANRAFVAATRELDAKLASAGLGPDRRLLVVDEAAAHNEEAWAKRLPQALVFLFPPAMDGTK